MKKRICSDENCSNLDGTLLVMIHLLVVKYSTYGLLSFREKYGDQIKSSFVQNLVHFTDTVVNMFLSGWFSKYISFRRKTVLLEKPENFIKTIKNLKSLRMSSKFYTENASIDITKN